MALNNRTLKKQKKVKKAKKKKKKNNKYRNIIKYYKVLQNI